jgi:hypothetical protein
MHRAFEQGRAAALAAFGIKVAEGMPPMPAAPPAPAASRFKLPSLGWKGTLGLMGAGAVGASVLGAHHQHRHDIERERLVYAPMQGGFQ